MGNGSVSSHRWQQDRQPTLAEQITYWQNQALQLRSERDQLEKTCERLTQKLATADRLLTEVVLYGFQTPTAPATQETYEPFSQ